MLIKIINSQRYFFIIFIGQHLNFNIKKDPCEEAFRDFEDPDK